MKWLHRPTGWPLPAAAEEVISGEQATVSGGGSACGGFTDLMTASLGAVLIEQELRVVRETRERLAFRRSG